MARFTLGGASPFGDKTDNLSAGPHIEAAAGNELVFGKLAVTPELMIYSRSAKGENGGIKWDESGFMVGVGAQADYYLWGPLAGFAAAHLGGGSWGSKQGSNDDSRGGFGMNSQWGVGYMIHRNFGAAISMGITRIFLSKKDDTEDKPPSAAAFDFGLQLKGRLPM